MDGALEARDRFRIRAGALCFVLSGIMTIAGLLLRGPNPVEGHALNASAFVAVSLDPMHNVTWALLLSNLVLQTFAWLALWAFVRTTRWERMAFWGAVSSIVGNGLFLPIAGVIAFTSPAVAQLYQGGNSEALTIAQNAIFGPLALPFLLASALTLLIGALMHAWVIARAPGLPHWAALPYALHALCLTVFAQVHFYAEFSGGPLLLLSGLAVAVSVWRRLDKQAPKASA